MAFPGGLPPRSRLDDLLAPNNFVWATGIEDTFIVEPSKTTGRSLDEYALTGHYDRWRQDFLLMGTLGVRCARYGIPWYKVEPVPGSFDWSWPDHTFGMLLDEGIQPIVDLVHYGVPEWLRGGLLAPEFPERMAQYAAAVAERYYDRIKWYTPLNEPRINAWYAGMLGWWPPYRRRWDGFLDVLLSISRAVCLTQRALKSVDPEIVCLHVDPADLYFTHDDSLGEETDMRQQVVFLALDLVTGGVDPQHALWNWLIKSGRTPDDLERFSEIAVEPDAIGLNCYPLYGWKEVRRSGNTSSAAHTPSRSGGISTKNRYASPELLDTLSRLYWQRYRRPLMISETASQGKKRVEWLEGSVAAVKRLREDGVPVVGYTWWPMYSIFGWAYRQGKKDLADYQVKLGLWDLDSNLNRVETQVLEAYRNVVASGSRMIGELIVNRMEVNDFALR